MLRCHGWLALAALCLAAPWSAAQDVEDNIEEDPGETIADLSSRIIGNQEQPKVLYVVPWQPLQSGRVDNGMMQSELSTVFEHLDENELRREIHFRQQFGNDSQGD